MAAKACGVRVNEFSIGMGPALWKKQKGETQYSLRLFPVGGFCAMEGEEEDSNDPAALNNQGFWAKLLIFAAGAAINFIAGLLIILALLPTRARAFSSPVMARALPTAARWRAPRACRPATACCASTASGCTCTATSGWLLGLNKTGVFDLVVERNGEQVTLTDFHPPQQTYTDQNGTSYTSYGLYFGTAEATLGRKLSYTWNNAVDFVRMVRLRLQTLVTGEAGVKDLSGPVGIVPTMTQVGEQSGSTRAAVENIAYLAALIAVNLAVMNLLPLPALDGGKIFFRSSTPSACCCSKSRSRPNTRITSILRGLCCCWR